MDDKHIDAMPKLMARSWRRGLPLLLTLLIFVPLSSAGQPTHNRVSAAALSELEAEAQRISRLHNVVVAERGEIILDLQLAEPSSDQPVNIKSLSKTVLAALVGAAIETELIEGVDQPIVELLASRVPDGADPRIADITVEHLLAQQAGLERTSGQYYGAWVASRDWVAYALSRPFVDRPGGRMLYSTGSSHLLSAALTDATGENTLALARRLLGAPLDITIPPWPQDPQGIYFGGNDMLLSPLALIRLGELYRHDGVIDGRRVLPEGWVEASWQPRGTSRWTGDAYGYGWFITTLGEERVLYGRGFGGQALYVVPEKELTVAFTADPSPGADGSPFRQELLHRLMARLLETP
nr:serine hydrolase [Halomonas sp.]